MIKWFEKNRWLSIIITLAIAIIIFYISGMEFPPGAPGVGLLAYLYHFLAFFWLAFFLLISFIAGKKKQLFLPALLIALIYALSDEFHQLFILYRTSSPSDFLIDSAGIFLASLIYLYSLKRKLVSRKKLRAYEYELL